MKLASLLSVLCTATILVGVSEASLSWLSISRMDNLNLFDASTCRKLIGWTGMQRRFCRQYFGFTDSIRQAAKLTISECQSQFAHRRWNCSTINRPRLFGRLPESGFRESSFVYALSSAALTYSITSACSQGKLADCSCDESRKGMKSNGYHWSGCSDNIAYGMGVAESFLDPRIRNKPSLMHLNLHNLETGRQMIEENMITQCKCHGVSGSCEIKTCWRAMPSFNLIGRKLKEKFDAATQVRIRKHMRRNNRARIVPRNQMFGQLEKSDLVFLNRSPDFCNANPRFAAQGTRGRTCNKNSRGIDGCDLLCCGRPYKTELVTVTYKCKCTFLWCCSVKCQECQSIQEVSTCT